MTNWRTLSAEAYAGGHQITDHDADNQQHNIAPYSPGEKDDDSEDGKGPCHRSGDSGHIPTERPGHTSAGQHHKCHAEIGSVAYSKYRGTCQRIAEQGLQQKSAHGQGRSGKQGRDSLRQTRAGEDDSPCRVVPASAKKNVQHLSWRNRDRPIKQVAGRQKRKQRQQHQVYAPRLTVSHRFPSHDSHRCFS